MIRESDPFPPDTRTPERRLVRIDSESFFDCQHAEVFFIDFGANRMSGHGGCPCNGQIRKSPVVTK